MQERGLIPNQNLNPITNTNKMAQSLKDQYACTRRLADKIRRENIANNQNRKTLENEIKKLEKELDALCQKVPVNNKGNPRHANYHEHVYYKNSQSNNFRFIYNLFRNVQIKNPDMDADDLSKALQNEVELIPDLIDIRDNRLKKIAEKFVAIREKRIELIKA